VGVAPPPCSPKSIYVLASLLEIKPLCEIAQVDINGKTYRSDFSSWVNSAQQKIMKMESEFFIPNPKDPKLIGFVSDNVGRIADGSSSHFASPLKLGLKKAGEVKRRRKGVQLRCPRNGCPRFLKPFPYSSVGSNLFCLVCPRSPNSYYLTCTGCGSRRTSEYGSCQDCRKNFV